MNSRFRAVATIGSKTAILPLSLVDISHFSRKVGSWVYPLTTALQWMEHVSSISGSEFARLQAILRLYRLVSAPDDRAAPIDAKPPFCYHLIGMSMLDTIRAKRDQVYALAREHKAEKLWVFGSCARGEERENSDIDFLVKYSPEASLFDDIRFERSLSALFSRGVDLVSSAVLPREVRFANRVCKEAVPV